VIGNNCQDTSSKNENTMKLIIATAIQEYQSDIKKILQQAEVVGYSYQMVKGYKNDADNGIENNWFASDTHETNSVAFFSFVKKENTDKLFELVDGFNATAESKSHIHLAELAVDRIN
jgi:hypothetical protein